MLNKLNAVEQKYLELENMLSDPAVLADMERWQKLNRERAAMEELVAAIRRYRAACDGIAEAKAILADESDGDLRELAAAELKEHTATKEELVAELPRLLLPKDPNDDRSVIVEIRGGVGGEEAALFVTDLFRMYARYAEDHHWKVDIMDSSPTELGGYKEISFSVEGYGAFSRLKYEGGTHRVQRVPATESQGRIHTSAVTVAVLPEAEEVEVDIRPEDLRIDAYRASGAGGQYVNRTDSAIRITYLPTGMVVTCQDEKSQLKNKEKALRVLRARVLEEKQNAQKSAVAADRKEQVGSGDRSQRIRTYNFPQGRVTDHRIGLTLHRLDAILAGDLDPVINPLITADQSERLRQNETL